MNADACEQLAFGIQLSPDEFGPGVDIFKTKATSML